MLRCLPRQRDDSALIYALDAAYAIARFAPRDAPERSNVTRALCQRCAHSAYDARDALPARATHSYDSIAFSPYAAIFLRAPLCHGAADAKITRRRYVLRRCRCHTMPRCCQRSATRFCRLMRVSEKAADAALSCYARQRVRARLLRHSARAIVLAPP